MRIRITISHHRFSGDTGKPYGAARHDVGRTPDIHKDRSFPKNIPCLNGSQEDARSFTAIQGYINVPFQDNKKLAPLGFLFNDLFSWIVFAASADKRQGFQLFQPKVLEYQSILQFFE